MTTAMIDLDAALPRHCLHLVQETCLANTCIARYEHYTGLSVTHVVQSVCEPVDLLLAADEGWNSLCKLS